VGVALCVPYAEREGDNVYNSAVVFDAHGELVLNYRKTHLWSSYEKVCGDATACADAALTAWLPHRISIHQEVRQT
jgi:predicted amidohydrolase